MQSSSSFLSRELKVLIAGTLKEIDLKLICTSVVDRFRFFEAPDGLSTTNKILNDPPDLVIMIEPLARRSAIEVARWLLSQPRFNSTGVLLLMDLPEEDLLIDEVIAGRVQILETPCERIRFEQTLRRLLNYIEHREQRDFYLRYLAANEILFNEGEPPEFVYILRKGQLVAQQNHEASVQMIGEIFPGEFVGEMAFINKRMRSATVVARTDCELIEIPTEMVDQVLFAKPSWARALVKTLSQRLERANRR